MSATQAELLLQELAHGDEFDYHVGSPHLKHSGLHRQLLALLHEELDILESGGLPLRVLDIGAGDGSFVAPLLARGCEVVATEISRPSIARLDRSFGRNVAFRALHDPGGTAATIPPVRASLLLFASVLHHIPDYEAALATAVARHLRSGGSFISLQDPLWYPRLGRYRHSVSELAFLSWRVTRGDFRRGVRSRIRRVRGAYRVDDPSDTVEYHVVRKGVDEQALCRLLEPRFDSVRLVKYWSTQATAWQSLGERLGMRNTFGIIASGHA